jgi:phosphoribosylformimino-5-aminoimidazole carboxamide ribotide isomerase
MAEQEKTAGGSPEIGRMEVIPSIDLWQGNVVRLRQGRYDEVTVYADDPVTVALGWRGTAARLHIVDLAGAKEGRAVQTELIRRIVDAFGPGVQVGGGVRSLDTVHGYFELGVERVVLGTAAVNDPELVRGAARAYPGRVILALDAKGGFVATRGWVDVSSHRASELARSYRDDPIAAVLYTDIERDGTEVGPNVTTTAELARDSGLPVIASGGVGTLEHLRQLGRASREGQGGIVGAVLGRSLHERRFSLQEAIEAAAG